jgi:hypothetical protein
MGQCPMARIRNIPWRRSRTRYSLPVLNRIAKVDSTLAGDGPQGETISCKLFLVTSLLMGIEVQAIERSWGGNKTLLNGKRVEFILSGDCLRGDGVWYCLPLVLGWPFKGEICGLVLEHVSEPRSASGRTPGLSRRVGMLKDRHSELDLAWHGPSCWAGEDVHRSLAGN